MRNKLAMCALCAGTLLGVGAWLACDSGASVSTAPAPAATAGAPAASAAVVGPRQLRPLSAGGPGTPEVLHHGDHRVWLEWETPGSAQDLCEGDLIPAALLRRDDPQGNIYAMVYASDPEHDRADHGETRHEGQHLSSGEDIDLREGETSSLMSYLGRIPRCLGCGDVRDLAVGISSVHDRDDGSGHAESYEIGPELTFAVHRRTHSVCAGGQQ